MRFFENLNFTSANEDGATELAAFSGQPVGRLLTLTGSGARALDMLLSDAGEVISLDMNPAQNHLLALKIAAYRAFTYPEMLAYLGIATTNIRGDLHVKLRPFLPPKSQVFWDNNAGLIKRGIWYAGLWERVLRFGALAIRPIRGRAIPPLFAAGTPQHQSQIWEDRFDDWIWRASIRLLGQRWVWTRFVGEPGGAFLPPPRQIEAHLAGAFANSAKRFLFRDSDFASLILRGRHDLTALPLHMQPQNFDRVRERVDRIRIVQGGLTDLDRLDVRDVNAFSLSDFGSYCDQDLYDACWNGVLSVAAPGAWFCERVFLNPLVPSSDRPRRDPAVSAQLTHADRSIIYDIHAGQIGP